MIYLPSKLFILLLLVTAFILSITSSTTLREQQQLHDVIFDQPSIGTDKTVLTLGYLTAMKEGPSDRQGLAISGAVTMALNEINRNQKLLPNVTLTLRWNDTRGDTVLATRAMTEMICDGVVAFFGPEAFCYVEAIVSQSRNIPMIAYKCPDYKASAIPTFARTEPPDTQVTKSIISLLRYYGWKKFSILHEETWTTVANSLKEQAVNKSMIINHKEKVSDNTRCCEKSLSCCKTSYWYEVIQNTMNKTRIYVFLGTKSSLVDMMTSMETIQLFSKGEYMVIFVDMMTYNPRQATDYLWKPEQLTSMKKCLQTESFVKRARSLLVIVSTPPVQADFENFTSQVREFNSKAPFFIKSPDIFKNFTKFVSIYAAYLYDSVKLYAWALDKLLKQEKRSLNRDTIYDVASNGTRIIDIIIRNRTYQSVTGATIKIDQNGDSEGNFSVLSFKPYFIQVDNFSCNMHMVPVANFQQGKDLPEYKLINGSVRVDWAGKERPFDEPMCGFMNELCEKDDRHITSVVIAGLLALTLFCSSVITMSIYRKWKIELEIEGLLWRIDASEIKGYFANDFISSPSKLSLQSAASYGSRYSNQIFTPTAIFRGLIVRIKELKFGRKKDISRDIMKEMRLLRELRHDNVNSFIGACVEPMRILLVTDYCAKGSLYDIIENEDIKLDELFITSLIHDLIKGMIYIHSSSIGFHGNLKSSNCVVTSRWMLQVTDFGLHELRRCAETGSNGEHEYRSLFWRAPELLRNPHCYGTQKGDVYSFAIILYEILSRREPFSSSGHEPKEIINLVKKCPLDKEQPFRPDLEIIIESGNYPDYVVNCMQDCWNEDPDIRPDFPTIRSRLKKMKGGKSKNIMDQMMEMMEKYAHNLEDLVNERTRLLCEEKKKTEDLLHRMLPESVAEKLTMGQGVEPESYDQVTIYFSDIVGFTAMSAESTPLQVVNFLNDLYTVFDRIIKGYDVYKVETIGDAYMVVSGLPIKNGDRHVGEIASMSLDLLQAVRQHKIAHRPNETLKLRIGIHTGPVVAGVVGLTMPRYCLFGDTVNTASRMESNGEALKIHISKQCKDALNKLGGYITEKRGLISLKGKGEVMTYWLVGATEKAIQRKHVDICDYPPPLFCRPRRSPKLNYDSRQPSLIGAHYFAGSRRQSSVPRTDNESTYSLQSSFYGVKNSPRNVHRKLEKFPLSVCGSGGSSFDGTPTTTTATTMVSQSSDTTSNVITSAPLSIISSTNMIVYPNVVTQSQNFYSSCSSTNYNNNYNTATNQNNKKEIISAPLSLLATKNITFDDSAKTNTTNDDGSGKLRCCDSFNKSSLHTSITKLTICDNKSIKKPLAMIKPHRILKSITSTSSQDYLLSYNNNNNSSHYGHLLLRESHSLNSLPEQISKKIVSNATEISSKLSEKYNSRSLDDATIISLVSKNPSGNIENDDETERTQLNNVKIREPATISMKSFKRISNIQEIEPTVPVVITAKADNTNSSCISSTTSELMNNNSGVKYMNNNCNGSINIYDAHRPLLLRQSSLANPNDVDDIILYSKRWHSLEAVSYTGTNNGNNGRFGMINSRNLKSCGENGGTSGYGSNGGSKKSNAYRVGRGSITTWLVNLFQGNGSRSSNMSLRKIGLLQSANNSSREAESTIEAQEDVNRGRQNEAGDDDGSDTELMIGGEYKDIQSISKKESIV